MVQEKIYQEESFARLLEATVSEMEGTCFVKRDNEILLQEDEAELRISYRDTEGEELMDIMVATEVGEDIQDGGYRLIDTIDLEQAFSDGISIMISPGELDLVLTSNNKIYHIKFHTLSGGAGAGGL